jgi:hypothetical protein
MCPRVLPQPAVREAQIMVTQSRAPRRTAISIAVAGALMAIPAPTLAGSGQTLKWESCGPELKAYD